MRDVSARYWTPVAVARRAAALLVTSAQTRVLDVGSGVGKFCLVGALTTRAHFTGLEHRPHLVEVARAVASQYGIERTSFVAGDLRQVEWSAFDALYFFNPFREDPTAPRGCLDHTVELSPARRRRDLELVYRGLEQASPGVRVVTYHTLGELEMPPCYERELLESAGTDTLELWVRAR